MLLGQDALAVGEAEEEVEAAPLFGGRPDQARLQHFQEDVPIARLRRGAANCPQRFANFFVEARRQAIGEDTQRRRRPPRRDTQLVHVLAVIFGVECSGRQAIAHRAQP